MTVISDKVKFLDALQVDEGILRFSGKFLLKSIVMGIVMGIIAIALWLFVGEIRIGAIVSIAVICGYIILNAHNAKKSHRDKSLNTALGVLGETVADVVFLPLIGMAICDRPMNNNERGYIKEEMREWGYSNEFIEQFIEQNGRKHIDTIRLAAVDLPSVLKMKSQREKGHGRIDLKDINQAGLCRKSYDMCNSLYNDMNNGLRDPVSDRYLSELKVRLKV